MFSDCFLKNTPFLLCEHDSKYENKDNVISCFFDSYEMEKLFILPFG